MNRFVPILPFPFLIVAVLTLTIPSLAFCGHPSSFSVAIPTDPVLAQARIDSVALGSDPVVFGTGSVAWGTEEGLLVEAHSGKAVWWNKTNSPFKSGEITSIAFLDGEIWAGNRNQFAGSGLARLEGPTWKTYHPKRNEMLSELVNRLFVDSKNRLWIGYEERGIDCFIGKEYGRKTLRLFKSIKVKHGLIKGAVLALTGTGDHLWVGTNQGLCRLNPSEPDQEKFSYWTYKRNFPARIVYSLTSTVGGEIAAGTDLGLAMWNSKGDSWSFFAKDAGLIGLPIKALGWDGKRLWVGTYRGLQTFSEGKFAPPLNLDSGLPSDHIRCLAVRRVNPQTVEVFVGTDKGARVITARD